MDYNRKYSILWNEYPNSSEVNDLFSSEPVMTFIQGDGTEQWWEYGSKQNVWIKIMKCFSRLNREDDRFIWWKFDSRIEMDLSQFGHTLVEMEFNDLPISYVEWKAS